MEGEADLVFSAAFSLDGTRILGRLLPRFHENMEQIVRIWNAQTGAEVSILE